LIMVNRAWSATVLSRARRRNRTATAVIVLVLALLVTIVSVAPLRAFFAFGALTRWELGVALASGFLAVAWFEVFKALRPAPAPDPRRTITPAPGAAHGT
jgi:Ca2+-transporting ATPase